MKQKFRIVPIIALLILPLCFSACEKDAITVKTERIYVEQLVVPPGEWSTAMSLTLKPNGRATLIEEGDMASDGRYTIKGRKLVLKTSSNPDDYKFMIISEQEIQAETGEKLILRQP